MRNNLIMVACLGFSINPVFAGTTEFFSTGNTAVKPIDSEIFLKNDKSDAQPFASFTFRDGQIRAKIAIIAGDKSQWIEAVSTVKDGKFGAISHLDSNVWTSATLAHVGGEIIDGSVLWHFSADDFTGHGLTAIAGDTISPTVKLISSKAEGKNIVASVHTFDLDDLGGVPVGQSVSFKASAGATLRSIKNVIEGDMESVDPAKTLLTTVAEIAVPGKGDYTVTVTDESGNATKSTMHCSASACKFK